MHCKISLIGESGAGKTSLSDRYIDGEFIEKTKTTIYSDFKVKFSWNEVPLSLYDTAGNKRFENMSICTAQNSNIFLVCVDLSNEKGLDNVLKYIDDYVSDKSERVFIVGTKSDLEQKISDEDINKYISKHNKNNKYEIDNNFYKTSAKDNFGIDEMFASLSNIFTKEINQQKYNMQNL
jgi:Ras-related protein Rab-7A